MSERLDFKGDYMGFSYGYDDEGNPIHSSSLGIVRTSDGSRFNENLLPTIQDKTVQVPGGDGMYYFGSYYTQRQFNIPFAFDNLTEEQFKNLKKHFDGKEIRDLIFDEKLDRVYSAKVTGTATIKHIPFNENGMTIYKDEGSIQFTCYYPFARAKDSQTGGTNNGDVPVPFKLSITGNDKIKTIMVGNTEINWSKLPAGFEATLNTKIGVVKIDKVPAEEKTYKVGDIANRFVTGNLTAKIPAGAKAPDDAVFYCEYI